jgi:hypothetical protein
MEEVAPRRQMTPGGGQRLLRAEAPVKSEPTTTAVVRLQQTINFRNGKE